LTGIQCVRNELGARDSSGRRHPNPIRGTEFLRRLDTLIITIGDEPDIDYMASMGIEINERGTLRTDPDTLATSRAGVFAGGDVVTGPNTVVDAIASGKKAALMIGRYLRREKMKPSEPMRIPQVYVAPCGISEEEAGELRRAEPPTLPIELRKRSFSEVELPLLEEDARREAKRCLRCDLEFTEFTASEPELATAGVKTV
jgi:NADH-quinone oxidoreductase subunit F